MRFAVFFGVDVGHIKLVSIGCARKRSFGLSGVTIYEPGTYVADGFFGGVSCLKDVSRPLFLPSQCSERNLRLAGGH